MVKRKSETTASKKRSIARRFNDILSTKSALSKQIDRRTARKIKRYRQELAAGATKGNKVLTALEVARRVDTLLEHGERLRDIKKLAKPWTQTYDEKEMTALISEAHQVFNFRADAYRFVGIRNETLVSAGVLARLPKKRGVQKGRRRK